MMPRHPPPGSVDKIGGRRPISEAFWFFLTLIGGVAVIVGLGIIALAWSAPVSAHDWYTGLHNELGETCCGGSDCAPLADGDVQAVPGGYLVKHLNMTVPTARAAPSEDIDGKYHLCFWGGQIRCFFVPASGS